MPLALNKCNARPAWHQCVAGSLGSLLAGAAFGVPAETIEILYEQGGRDGPGAGLWLWILAFFLVVALGIQGAWQLRLRRRLRTRDDLLQQAENRLREAQLIARIGSWSRDFASGETFWSAEACKVLELEGREADFKHFERLIHPEDLQKVTEVVASAYCQGGSYLCDHRVVCPNGREKYIRLAGQVFLGEGNAPVRETGTVQDITDRRHAELALQRSERRLRSILDVTPYPILILENADAFPVLYANRATLQLVSLGAGTVAEELKSQFLWIDSKDRTAFIARVLEEKTGWREEMRLRDSTGRSFWAELSGGLMDFAGVDAIFMSIVDISERKHIQMELERLAITDVLTGVLNRRSFLTATHKELRRSMRYRHPFSILVLDIDHFRRANDSYGHGFGDNVIRRFAEVIRECLREEDLLGRVDGEEFAAVLVSSEAEGGYLVAERIRKRWQDEVFEHDGARFNFTASIGVARLLKERDSVEAVMERAESGLGSAKRAGRNCVIVFSGDGAADKPGDRRLESS